MKRVFSMTIQAILTDIEGTTSDIAFVHNVLFPYAARKLPEFIREHAEQTEVAAILQDTREHIGQPQATQDELIELHLRWIETDQKVTPLKALQGLIWKTGYEQGDFTGHIYADAAEKLQQWHAQGLRLYVYSSGSEQAQKLLFGYSDMGDLTPLFSGYFDTRIGGKKEAESYAAIAEQLVTPVADILFLSDVEAELNAAQAAGMQTCLLARGEPDVTSTHPLAQDFHEASTHFELP